MAGGVGGSGRLRRLPRRLRRTEGRAPAPFRASRTASGGGGLISTVESRDEGTSTRRARLLTAAKDVFLRYGLDRTSVADLAAAAGVSRTSLYHYFSSREAVFRAVVDEINREALAASEQAADGPGVFQDRLIAVLDARLGHTLRLLRTSPHAVELSEAGHAVVGAAMRSADEAYLGVVSRLLQKAQASGEAGTAILADDPAAAAEFVVFAAKGLMRDIGGLAAPEVFAVRLKRLAALFAPRQS